MAMSPSGSGVRNVGPLSCPVRSSPSLGRPTADTWPRAMPTAPSSSYAFREERAVMDCVTMIGALWRAHMKTIETTQTAGPDKLLHVTIPVDEANRPYRMVIVLVPESEVPP